MGGRGCLPNEPWEQAVSRDDDRSEVYAAELSAVGGTTLEQQVPLRELHDAAAAIVASAWWPTGPVAIRSARSDARSSRAQDRGDQVEIRLAAGQHDMATLIHELAHALAGTAAGHGPIFRAAHLDLMSLMAQPADVEWLRLAYAAHGLKVGERRWEQPPPATGEPSVDGRDARGRFVL